jgi:predicted membrane-bound dolichyl-phosphate-mannose-protein mannosyltransferase
MRASKLWSPRAGMRSDTTDGVRRLSYADRALIVLALAGLIAAMLLGYWVSRDAYFYARALGDRYVSDEIYYVDVARRLLIDVFHVSRSSWYNWSGKTGSDYFNPEHPPLGKYIIGLSMILCGDKPLCWRLPGVVEAGTIPVILYAGYFYSRRDAWGILAGLATALGASSLLSLRYEAAVAMLDIHQAFFSALAIAALAAGRPILFLAFTGLAASVKYSGFFLIPALWLYIPHYCSGEESWVCRAKLFIYSILIPPLVVVTVSLPLIYHFGTVWFWKNSVIGALSWHTSNRPPGPPTSSPMGWMLNVNPFYFDYDTLIGGVANPLVYLIAIPVGAILVVYTTPATRRPASGSAAFFSALGLYLLLFNLGALHIPGLHGNKTLYSFYLVQLSPLAAAVYGDAVLVMGGRREG